MCERMDLVSFGTELDNGKKVKRVSGYCPSFEGDERVGGAVVVGSKRMTVPRLKVPERVFQMIGVCIVGVAEIVGMIADTMVLIGIVAVDACRSVELNRTGLFYGFCEDFPLFHPFFDCIVRLHQIADLLF